MLTCTVCGASFKRKGARGPIPRYCSGPCKRAPYREKKRRYDFLYYRERVRDDPERMEAKRAYQHDYYRRPEVRDRYRLRWYDPEYRERENARRRVGPPVPIPAPYTGHRWLDRAKQIVSPQLDHSAPWADQYHDDMGEALLALLEGRDPAEAVRDYRKREYVPRHRTVHMDDFRNDDGSTWFDNVLPPEPSAEEEVEARETIGTYIADRFNDVSTRRRKMKQKTQQPSRRRQKDSGWRKHAA